MCIDMDGCGCVLTKHDLWKQTAGQSWPEGRSLPTSNLNTLLCPTEPCNLLPRVHHTRSALGTIISFYSESHQALPCLRTFAYPIPSPWRNSLALAFGQDCVSSFFLSTMEPLRCYTLCLMWHPGWMEPPWKDFPIKSHFHFISILWFPSLEGHITNINYLIVYLYFGFGFCLPPPSPPWI